MIDDSVENLRSLVDQLTIQLEDARSRVQAWTDANAQLSLNAQEARAKNQARGNTGWSVLLGAKYRAVERRIAATSNAHIAQEVAEKRLSIAASKRSAQEDVKALQASLTEAKKRLKNAETQVRQAAQAKPPALPLPRDDAKTATAVIDLMLRLKAARDAGVLTEQEYEEKRVKLLGRL